MSQIEKNKSEKSSLKESTIVNIKNDLSKQIDFKITSGFEDIKTYLRDIVTNNILSNNTHNTQNELNNVQNEIHNNVVIKNENNFYLNPEDNKSTLSECQDKLKEILKDNDNNNDDQDDDDIINGTDNNNTFKLNNDIILSKSKVESKKEILLLEKEKLNKLKEELYNQELKVMECVEDYTNEITAYYDNCNILAEDIKNCRKQKYNNTHLSAILDDEDSFFCRLDAVIKK